MSHSDSTTGICCLGILQIFKMHFKCSEVNTETDLSASLKDIQTVLTIEPYYVCFAGEIANLSITVMQHCVGDNICRPYCNPNNTFFGF